MDTLINNVVLLGLGYKARNGKDSVANFLNKKLKYVKIVHWADGVYEECRNEKSNYPLIIRHTVAQNNKENEISYSLLNDKHTGSRLTFTIDQVPYIHKIFNSRHITEYGEMYDKDPEILQFWGTNFRRQFCDKNYWVNYTLKKINELLKLSDSIKYIIIPDTRFINEVEAVHNYGGLYIKVVRTNDDGSTYIAKDRDPNHQSEIELENYPADVTLTATDLIELEKEVDNFILNSKLFK